MIIREIREETNRKRAEITLQCPQRLMKEEATKWEKLKRLL
jgi:hypothetical protein